MKRLFTLLLSIGFSFPLFAQEQTLDYMDNGVLYVNPFGSGYIPGTNGYGDIGKYQRFDLTHGIQLRAVSLYLGAKEIKGSPDSLKLVVRSKQDTIPAAYLSTVKLALSQFTDPEGATRIDLPFPLNFAALDSFFVGIEWDNTIDDEFALLADLANRAWEQYNDGTFHSFNENSNFSWHLDTDLHIRLHFFPTTGVQNIENEYFSLYQNQPNPAREQTTVRFDLKEKGAVRMEIMDVLGRLYQQIDIDQLPAGSHRQYLDLQGLAPGNYLLRLYHGQTFATQLFNVCQD
jgi:Secretion system C-terminal sorting domain